MAPNLPAYLDRIGFRGAVRPDLPTLRAIHRAHAETIPYENLDVQLGRPVTRAIGPIFEKLVARRRGGWCYEMNGLLSWALEEIGFEVTRLAGGVGRETVGDAVIGNHLVPIVDLGEPLLVDAGFGNGPFEPVRLREGPFEMGPLRCELRRLDGGWRRYVDDPRSGGPSFDFNLDVRDESRLEERCRFLQTDPASPFVLNAVVQRWRSGVHYSLRGRVLATFSDRGKETHLVSGPEDYVATLRETFALDLPEAAALWPKIAARHEEVMSGAPRP